MQIPINARIGVLFNDLCNAFRLQLQSMYGNQGNA